VAEDVKHADAHKTADAKSHGNDKAVKSGNSKQNENKDKKDRPKMSDDDKKRLQEVWASMTPEEQQNCITRIQKRQDEKGAQNKDKTPEEREALKKTRSETPKDDKQKACWFHMHEESQKNGANSTSH